MIGQLIINIITYLVKLLGIDKNNNIIHINKGITDNKYFFSFLYINSTEDKSNIYIPNPPLLFILKNRLLLNIFS